MAAQRKAVGDYLNGGCWKLVGEFTEVESGKRSDRPELEKGPEGLPEAQGKACHCEAGSTFSQRTFHQRPYGARGVKLGGPRLPAINETLQARALERARAIAPILSELAGMSARSVAAELNARQVETPSGAPWSAKTVIRARERLAV